VPGVAVLDFSRTAGAEIKIHTDYSDEVLIESWSGFHGYGGIFGVLGEKACGGLLLGIL